LIRVKLNLPKALAVAACMCFLPYSGSSPGNVFSPTRAHPTEPALSDTAGVGLWEVGEELTYNVSYASINIGQVRIKLLEKIAGKGRDLYKAIAYIDSYSGIPFVNLDVIYESVFDETIYSEEFRSRIKDGGMWYETQYEFRYPERTMHYRKGWLGSSTVEVRDSITVDTVYQDGLSLYYYARRNLRLGRTIVVPTIIQEEKVRTEINFTNKETSAEIDALEYPVDVIEFEGTAGFVGVYGMTGRFEGWFSNDEARVPILAKMQVIIGSVRIELMRWKRPGWAPPAYVEKGPK